MGWKKGDEVRCLKSYWDEGVQHFTKGKTYFVSEWFPPSTYLNLRDDTGWVRTLNDDTGGPNGWNAKHFELVTKENKMNKKIVHLKTNNSITLIYDGQTKVVAKQDDRFEKILAAIKAGREQDIPAIVDPAIELRKAGLQVEEGLVTLNGEAMPAELNSRILDYKKHGLPYSSLTNFWKNLQENPSFNSRQQLFKFLENKGHPITEDGYFVGYRGVTEDFKDKRTGKFDNSIGARCEMPRHAVDDNPNNTCSYGLHVGSYDYAKDFGRGGKFVMVKVHPRDVVSVPNDYNGQKMRVCAFEVLSEASDMLDTPVVNHKGGRELRDKYSAVPQRGEAISGDALALFESTEKPLPMTASQKRAHKARYSNNHAKRDKTGKFTAKKRK